MGTVNSKGRFDESSKKALLNAMVADLETAWGEDLPDEAASVVRDIYEPVAERLAAAQEDIGLILDAAQIEFASGAALDLLTALIGVQREPARKATGDVTFSRDTPADTDYVVSKGTLVQTGGSSPLRFETTKQVTLKGPFSFSDGTLYSTTSTTFKTKTSTTVDVDYRDSLDVSADIKTSSATYAAHIEIVDVTNGTTIHTTSTTNTALTTVSAVYDVSALSGDIDVEYRIKTANSAATASMDNAAASAVGQVGVDAPVAAEYGGAKWNVGAETITVIPNGVTGIESVNNAAATTGGKDREEDDELRERAQEQLANGARATGPALVSAVKSVEGVTSVSILINDTDTDNGRGYGLPAHSFEMIVTHDGLQETMEAVAQALMDTKAVGDYSAHGVNGQALDESLSFVVNGEITTELPNGQTHPVGYSESVKVEIYVDADYTYKAVDYPGDDAVKDAIVDYIGGWTSSGFEQDGQLSTNDDVLYGEIEYAIRSVPGVYDVSSLTIGTTSSPTGTSNITIGSFEQAITDARASANFLTLTSTEK